MKNQIKKLLAISLLTVTLVSTYSCSSSDDSSSNGKSSFVVNPNDLNGDITSGEVVLTNDKVYQLTGDLIVKTGATLTIKSGTRIEATGISYVAVEQGAKIFIEGTKSSPVVFTSTKKEPGSWGGIVICGKAPINKADQASAEVSGLTYGGTDVNDNSGSIKYLRIEYSGYAYNSEKEFNGLSLFGVGNGTTIEYVQVHEGADDGFEWFGGTVNARYLVSTSNEDDQFDWTEGWNGTGEYWYAKQGLGRGNRGIEADNNANNRSATPVSSPTISNLTLIGLGVNNAGAENQAMKLREGTYGIFNNVYLTDFKVGFDVQHDETINAIGKTLKMSNVKFGNIETKAKFSDNVDRSAALYSESTSAIGAGNGAQVPVWAQGWTTGL
jgi:uncharacterized protein YcfL